jgi:hypothetical protein
MERTSKICDLEIEVLPTQERAGDEESQTSWQFFCRIAQRGHTSQKPVVLAGEV